MQTGIVGTLIVVSFVTLTGCGNAPPGSEQAPQGNERAARDTNRMDDLRHIGMSFHDYHDNLRAFPPSPWAMESSKDGNGKPFLSWRVQLLPFIEQRQLVGKFHFNEPWDSEHNLKLLKEMPPLYRTTDDPTKTTLLTFYGNGAFHGGDQMGCTIEEIKDGTSNTLMIVEAGADRAVPWTKPDDLQFDPANPKALLGKLEDDFFFAVMCDGQVVKLRADIDPAVLSALITRAGGESVDAPSQAQP